jgi:hypothetical protein
MLDAWFSTDSRGRLTEERFERHGSSVYGRRASRHTASRETLMDLGPLAVAGIAVAAVLVLGLLLLLMRSLLLRRGKGRGRGKSGLMNQRRVEVLETTVIDEERKLVLVRCDKVEHLIMIGGPADVVVENDVKKVRPAAGPGAKPASSLQVAPAGASPLRVQPATMPAAAGASLEAAIAAAAPKSSEASRPAARPIVEPHPPTQPRAAPVSSPPQPSRTTARTTELPPLPKQPRDEGHGLLRGPASRPGNETQLPRRDATPRRAPAIQTGSHAASARGNDWQRTQPGNKERSVRQARGSRAPDEATTLPTAQVPWPETDSIENEIVEALGSPARPGDGPTAKPMTGRSILDSSSTLGDLADRLEEALAREIQAPAQASRAEREELAAEEEAERPKRAPGRERQEKRDRTERAEASRQAQGAGESEARRDAPQTTERREETPVISLNARRREAADPIEDEMARLLGELTGDTKGR